MKKEKFIRLYNETASRLSHYFTGKTLENGGKILQVGGDVVIPPKFADVCKTLAVAHLETTIATLGLVKLQHFRQGKLICEMPFGKNIWTTQGMAWALNVLFGSTPKPTAIYGGIFKNNVTPALGDTAAVKLGASGDYGECQDADYSPATNRPGYITVNTTTATITNSASPLSFTMVQAFTIYGAFLTTRQAKTDTTGVLVCAKKLASARVVEAADVIAITYNQSLISS